MLFFLRIILYYNFKNNLKVNFKEIWKIHLMSHPYKIKKGFLDGNKILAKFTLF